MKITRFEELTQFVSDEYLKIVDTYNIQKPSDGFIKFIEKTLEKYTKLYDKPLYKLQKIEVKNMYFVEKQNLVLDKAFATMPHSKLWKCFHKDLWEKMKYRDESLQNDEKIDNQKADKPIPTVPSIIVKQVSPPVMADDVEV